MAKVFIGVDPHKLSATIEVVDDRERVLATGQFGTDRVGYAAMRKHVQAWPERVWAVEGSNGAGRPLAQRLLADREDVVDVPAKLSARARLFDTGHNRKTDAHDTHAVAVVAVRTQGLRVLSYDEQLEALRMLADRREELTRQRVQTVNQLHRLLAELTPGKGKKNLTAWQAEAILASVRPRDLAGKTRRRLAAEQLAPSPGSPTATGSRPGPAPPRSRPPPARIVRHRLSRSGNRRMNHMIHIAATTQIRLDTPGRAYYRRKLAAGKTRAEAMRCLKRRISDALYRQLVTVARAVGTGPGGHCGATLTSSAADLPPHIDTSDQPLPQGLGKVGSWGPDLRVCGGAGVTDVACVAAGRAWDPR